MKIKVSVKHVKKYGRIDQQVAKGYPHIGILLFLSGNKSLIWFVMQPQGLQNIRNLKKFVTIKVDKTNTS